MHQWSPAEWRDASRSARHIAADETDPHLKRLWASHAFFLAQLAETIERRDEDAMEQNRLAD